MKLSISSESKAFHHPRSGTSISVLSIGGVVHVTLNALNQSQASITIGEAKELDNFKSLVLSADYPSMDNEPSHLTEEASLSIFKDNYGDPYEETIVFSVQNGVGQTERKVTAELSTYYTKDLLTLIESHFTSAKLNASETAEYKYTVIGYYEDSGQTFCHHKNSNSPQNAFYQVASEYESAVLISVVSGHLSEGNGIDFAGDSLVDAKTVLSQPEVFSS